MTRHRISETLTTDKERIFCRDCDSGFAVAGAAWKPAASLRTTPLSKVSGMGENVSKTAVMREFFCPDCGFLLDTEVALPEDPFLNDIVVP
jgi:acetone carboxylase gamma subunit